MLLLITWKYSLECPLSLPSFITMITCTLFKSVSLRSHIFCNAKYWRYKNISIKTIAWALPNLLFTELQFICILAKLPTIWPPQITRHHKIYHRLQWSMTNWRWKVRQYNNWSDETSTTLYISQDCTHPMLCKQSKYEVLQYSQPSLTVKISKSEGCKGCIKAFISMWHLLHIPQCSIFCVLHGYCLVPTIHPWVKNKIKRKENFNNSLFHCQVRDQLLRVNCAKNELSASQM